jgi:hypothetical protein
MNPRTLSTLLIATLLFPTLYNMGMLTDYALRYDHYKTVLCENQDKPELKCNGTCQFAQEVQRQQEQEPPTLHSLFEWDHWYRTSYELSSTVSDELTCDRYNISWLNAVNCKEWKADIPVPPPRR